MITHFTQLKPARVSKRAHIQKTQPFSLGTDGWWTVMKCSHNLLWMFKLVKRWCYIWLNVSSRVSLFDPLNAHWMKTDMFWGIVKILPCCCQNFLALLFALRNYWYFLFGKKKKIRKVWNEAPNMKVAFEILEALLNYPSFSENSGIFFLSFYIWHP